MSRFISVFISVAHQRAIGLLLWLAIFVVALVASGWLALHQFRDSMAAQADATVGDFVELRGAAAIAFSALRAEAVAAPCSPAFHEQLRKIAYRPDGLNEFLYAPGGAIHCSVNGDFAVPVELGPPDLDRRGELAPSMWFDRPLDFLGLDGLFGTIVSSGDFGIVVPPQPDASRAALAWMRQEGVLIHPDGGWSHRGGVAGLYAAGRAAEVRGGLLPASGGTLHHRSCSPAGYYCVAVAAGIGDIVAEHSAILAVVVAGCGLLAAWLANLLHTMLRRYWAFEARFRRRLSAETVICTYQPLMDLQSGAITGCEVLVRWRDVDGSTVTPDRFLGIVEEHGMTMQLTRYVVERAREELVEMVPEGQPFQVNFNIFPRDLQAERLLEVFAVFDDVPGRFQLVVEIVESAALDLEAAQRQIELLQRAGIRTYLDDFGTGHSNIHHLAALSLDGVKLDRGFAMAPDESLMGQMLANAIQMIHASGRAIVIEGVETEERLAMLRATGQVDYVQGYLISRPLEPAPFADFLAARAGAALRRVA